LTYQSSYIGPNIGVIIVLTRSLNYIIKAEPYLNYYFCQDKLNDNNMSIQKVNKRLYFGLELTLGFGIRIKKPVRFPIEIGYTLKMDKEAKVIMNRFDFPLPLRLKF